MATTHFTSAGIKHWQQLLAAHVERGDIPALAAGIVLDGGHGQHTETMCLGTVGPDGRGPVSANSVFRVASLTKPVVAVAAMILLEQGKMALDDEIARWLPELSQRRVLRSLDSELDDTVPASREITVRDVLTYRMGIGSIMAMPGTYPIQTAIGELKVGGDGPPMPTDFLPQDQWLKNLGSLPLVAQPGELWLYHVSGDVLGALISRVAGESLSTFLEKNIFQPLDMPDTGFFLRGDQAERLTECVYFNHETGALDIYDSAADSAWASAPVFESGGGGLLSTLDDCLAFGRMLLNKGSGPHGPILSPESVDLMTQNHLTPANRVGTEIFFGNYGSWGLGLGVNIAHSAPFHRPGRFGWDGGFGTSAYTDPETGLTGVLLTQRMMDSPEPPRVFTDFWTATYSALA